MSYQLLGLQRGSSTWSSLNNALHNLGIRLIAHVARAAWQGSNFATDADVEVFVLGNIAWVDALAMNLGEERDEKLAYRPGSAVGVEYLWCSIGRQGGYWTKELTSRTLHLSRFCRNGTTPVGSRSDKWPISMQSRRKDMIAAVFDTMCAWPSCWPQLSQSSVGAAKIWFTGASVGASK